MRHLCIVVAFALIACQKGNAGVGDDDDGSGSGSGSDTALSDCTCYLGYSDCPGGNPICQNAESPGCSVVTVGGKMKDGTCSIIGVATDAARLAPAFDLYFAAYETAAKNEQARPDPTLWDRATAAVPDGVRAAFVQDLVHGALDVLIGFDFMRPNPYQGLDEHGALRVEGQTRFETIALIAAARTGFGAALRAADPEVMILQLERFWALFPGYHPMHTGRCYPHGHVEQTLTPAACQADHFRRLIRSLVRKS